MSDDNQQAAAAAEEAAQGGPQETNAQESQGLKLQGLFAFKEGMTTIYTDEGVAVPVTVLRYEPLVVSQIKTAETDGYSALQLACRPVKAKNASKSQKGHFKKAGFENGAQIVREIRQDIPEGVDLGAKVSISSFAKGDKLKITSKSKGRGFAGVMRRYDFGGGPAAHGSTFHRQPGSIGNRTWPGRVMAGRKLPGHYGDKTVTMTQVEVVDVLQDENILFVKGGVPGGRNSLVKLMRDRG